MHTIEARNVNEALQEALWWLDVAGVREKSRNGQVIVSPEPVATVYEEPCERVLFSEIRDANPYFHLMEALWMLAGRNDVSWPSQFNSNFKNYAEPNGEVHGAYGYRWRSRHDDQLAALVKLLRKSPDTRRAVLSMWAPEADLLPEDANDKRDLPCNTHAYFSIRRGALSMFVCCRSNDALWGAYGANAVHFSILLEYLALWGGWKVGTYTQMSYNLHAYTAIDGYPPIVPVEIGCDDRYSDADLKLVPLIRHHVKAFDEDLGRFMSDPMGDTAYTEPFFNNVVAPMYASWHDRKTKKNDGMLAAHAIKAEDWRMACQEWILRRTDKKEKA